MQAPSDGSSAVAALPSSSDRDSAGALALARDHADKPEHECGVFAVYGSPNAARTIFFALFALYHRGQESAGIATSHHHTFHVKRGMGLVSQIFSETSMSALTGRMGIGHTRYSTAGSSSIGNAQPFLLETDLGQIAVAHNGQLTRVKSLRRQLMRRGTGLYTSTDSEVIAQLLARPVGVSKLALGSIAMETEDEDEGAHGGPGVKGAGAGGEAEAEGAPPSKKKARTDESAAWPEDPGAGPLSHAEGHRQAQELGDRIAALIQRAEGAYSFVVMSRTAIFGARDRLGLRPLCIGQRTNEDGSKSFMFASESCALGTVGAHFVREVVPGEIVTIDRTGVSSRYGLGLEMQVKVPRALCVFEYVYFARPDSLMEGQLVHAVRQRLGAALAKESAVASADIVSGVPDSSIAAAIGYSMESGKPYTEVFCKNRYIGRTFIQPDDTLRKNAIHLKFNALAHNLEGRSLVLVDDSLVRGNTLRKLVPMLREAGAREVHIRISSPPLRHPCYMGVDIGSYEELIAHRVQDVDAIRRHIGADSLAYLSLDAMLGAVREGISDQISSGQEHPPGEAGAPAAAAAAPERTESPSMMLASSGVPPVPVPAAGKAVEAGHGASSSSSSSSSSAAAASSSSAGGAPASSGAVDAVGSKRGRSRSGSVHVLQGDAVAIAEGDYKGELGPLVAQEGAGAGGEGKGNGAKMMQSPPKLLGATTAGAAPGSAGKSLRLAGYSSSPALRPKSGMLSPTATATVPPPPGGYGKLDHCSACFTGKYPLPVEEW